MSKSPVRLLRHCMSVGYVRSNENRTEDALIVKERIRHPETGQERPHLRIVENYERSWWISNAATQKEHTQKREYELLENLNEYRSTDAAMPYRVARALGKHGQRVPRMSELARSPYVYGTDISAAVLYKHEADEANKAVNGNWVPDSTVAVADYETNVHSDTEEIITGAISFKDKALIAIDRNWLGSMPAPEDSVRQVIDRYLAKEIVERKMQYKVVLVDNDLAVCRAIMNFAHHFKPDFLAFWNMNFDINKMIESCDRHRVDPSLLFCDPSLPMKYRNFRWREDRANQVTASGKRKNKDPSETWNVVEAPASFYIIDAMCVFRMLRVIEGKRHSYGLDAILKSETDVRKLEIEGVDGNHNLLWHRYMQREKKAEYCAYNLFDCISVEILDETVQDLSKKIALYADGSEFGSLNSNPKRLANSIHMYLLKQGKVLCSTSDDMTEEFDRFTLDRRNWIVTLANEFAELTGLAIFREQPDLIVRIAKDVADIDITSGYPTAHVVANVSKSTTLAEICAIRGLTTMLVKQVAVNMMAVPANAVGIANTVLKMPTLTTIDKTLAGIDSYDALVQAAEGGMLQAA